MHGVMHLQVMGFPFSIVELSENGDVLRVSGVVLWLMGYVLGHALGRAGHGLSGEGRGSEVHERPVATVCLPAYAHREERP